MKTVKRKTHPDARLRREFGLRNTTMVILPGPSHTCLVQLTALTEEQTRAILSAAKKAGVDLGAQDRKL